MEEKAFFFKNSSGEQLFAYQHLADNPSATGVIFCHPFGEEKTRSYRSLVNFARHLSEIGVPSLRFDMKGAGDSDGDLVDLTIESQIADTIDAVTVLIEQTGASNVILVGLRLGASIAALAAERDPRINKLLLLSPIIKGASYWRDILRMKQFASIWLGKAAPKSSELMQHLEKEGHIEIEGQLLGHEFITQLQSINLLKQELTFSGDVLITSVEKDSLGCQFANELGERYLSSAKSSLVWTKEERDYWSVLSLFDQYHPQPTYHYAADWFLNNESSEANKNSEVADKYREANISENLQRAFFIDAPSGRLFAIEHKPESSNVRQCVIMLNSGMVNRCGPQRIYRALAIEACEEEIAVIRVDLAGVGDSVAEIYETHFDNHRKEDVNAVINYARQQWPEAKIVLQGICAGARVSFKAAAKNPEVAGILSWSNEIYTASQNMPQSPTEPEDRMSEYVVSDTFSRAIRFLITFKFLRPKWWKEQFPGGKGIVDEFVYTMKCIIKKILPSGKKSIGEFLESADLYLKDKRKVFFAFGEHDTLAYGEFKSRFPNIPEGTDLEQCYIAIETGTHTFSTLHSQRIVIDTSIKWVKKHIG